MMHLIQHALFEDLAFIHPVRAESDASIRERFEAFDAQNPQVFEALRELCLEMKRRGAVRWSIKAAYEVTRWMPALRTRGETYRLCNDYHSLYSRKLMAEVAELRGFFECRQLRRPE